MRRFLAGCAAALMACAAGAAQAEPAVWREFRGVGEALTAGRCDAPRTRKLIARRDFNKLSGAARSVAYSGLAICEPASLQDAAMKAAAEPDALALAWSVRFLAAVERKDMPDALEALGKAVDRKADGTLTLFSDEFVYRVARDLRDDSDAFRQFAAELDRAGWTATQPYYDGDFIWARYAAMLLEAGDDLHAWRIGSRVNEPEELIRMSLDRRFDKIMAIDSQRFDVVVAAEAALTRARAIVEASPLDGSAVTIASNMLRLLGRQAEALALIDETLARPGDIRDFRGEDHRNWLINDRALTLMELGRFDEGVDAMTKAATLKERGAVNVSQVINLSGLQISAGRFDAALATLATAADGMTGKVSPYGSMWVAAEQACAYQGLGRATEAALALAVTAAEANENHGAHAKALLCVGDLDALAAAYKARLDAPSSRSAALLQLSRFRDPPLTAFDAELGRRMERLRVRPDIRAAVDAVGRTKDFPFQSGSLIDGL